MSKYAIARQIATAIGANTNQKSRSHNEMLNLVCMLGETFIPTSPCFTLPLACQCAGYFLLFPLFALLLEIRAQRNERRLGKNDSRRDAAAGQERGGALVPLLGHECVSLEAETLVVGERRILVVGERRISDLQNQFLATV